MKTPKQIHALAKSIRANPTKRARRNPSAMTIREKYESCVLDVKGKPTIAGPYGICTASMYRAYGKAATKKALAPLRRRRSNPRGVHAIKPYSVWTLRRPALSTDGRVYVTETSNGHVFFRGYNTDAPGDMSETSFHRQYKHVPPAKPRVGGTGY